MSATPRHRLRARVLYAPWSDTHIFAELAAGLAAEHGAKQTIYSPPKAHRKAAAMGLISMTNDRPSGRGRQERCCGVTMAVLAVARTRRTITCAHRPAACDGNVIGYRTDVRPERSCWGRAAWPDKVPILQSGARSVSTTPLRVSERSEERHRTVIHSPSRLNGSKDFQSCIGFCDLRERAPGERNRPRRKDRSARWPVLFACLLS